MTLYYIILDIYTIETPEHFVLARIFAVASMFGGVVGSGMCEPDEHTGVGASDKASEAKC